MTAPPHPVRTPLTHGWRLQPGGGPVPPQVRAAGAIPASVPGCVHTDLLAADLIPDPYLDRNEALVQWIGLAEWRYETELEINSRDGDRHDLVFEGLDTIAAVQFNGEPVARTQNMHRTYRIDVSALVRAGPNSLQVTFASPVREADTRSEALGRRPHVNHHPYNAIRKMACNFGWDWGPDLATAGIWRTVALESWSCARLAAVRPQVGVDGSTGTVRLHVDIEWADTERADTERADTERADTDPSGPGGGELTLVARVDAFSTSVTVAAGQTSAVLEVAVPDAELWWPRGYGGQPLYGASVQLLADGSTLHTWQSRIGFRVAELRTETDADGTSFQFVVNGKPVWVRGANWIPDDAFPHRVTPARYAERIEQAADAGINLLRVWGGGIFEADAFYDRCDELGVLTWQDFLFACATYAEEDPLRAEVLAEARDNIVRLLPHPSLVLWNGNNENLMGYADWGWPERLDGASWGAGYYYELLPALLQELDGTRSYTPGSPCSPRREQHPNDPDHGSVHVWDVWNTLDYTAYRDLVPRFVAEFGWQGPPAWATLRRSISDEPLTPESPAVNLHQKAEHGNLKLELGLAAHFPQPAAMPDFHWAMSLNQARAITFALEHYRSHSPRCSGAVVWQLNDCWPATSWAAVDGDGRRKPLWYALRNAYADRLLTIQPRSGTLAVIVSNDRDQPWSESLTLTRRTFAGQVLARTEFAVDVGARTSLTLPVPDWPVQQPGAELLVAELAGARRALWFHLEDRDLALPTPQLTALLSATDGGYDLHLTAGSLVRDLCLLADKLAPDAQVDDALITLLPGESAVLGVRTGAAMTLDALMAAPVLRSANQLVRPRADLS